MVLQMSGTRLLVSTYIMLLAGDPSVRFEVVSVYLQKSQGLCACGGSEGLSGSIVLCKTF